MNFELVLAVTLAVTGLIWFIDLVVRLYTRQTRPQTHPDVDDVGRRPWLIDFARSFFPVLLFVFVLRSFIVEPFRIPSGSMLPTLQIGDFILVNKYEYGLRLPILDDKIISVGKPDYGDVMVFRYPHDEEINYIKRVIGVPGDEIIYHDKTVHVNGQQVTQEYVGNYTLANRRASNNRRLQLTAISETHASNESFMILHDEKRPSVNLRFEVPEGHYFVMGDNRDHSNDSRFWGFVPEENIVGRAFFVWFSWNYSGDEGIDWSRIGNSIK